MERREFLQTSALGISGLLAGCVSTSFRDSATGETDTPTGPQAGSGHSCSNPRVIDYQAVTQRQDNRIYLENSTKTVQTVCVTVSDLNQPTAQREDNPPLVDTGYSIHAGRIVELFAFRQPGRYRVEIKLSGKTETETFERTQTQLTDENRRTATFELTGPDSIKLWKGKDSSSLTAWERSTDCEGKHDGMHDSVIRVEAVTQQLEAGYSPIQFSSLPPAQQEILRPVTENGGYGTCNASAAFHDIVERAMELMETQGSRGLYLHRDGTYYRLYIESGDEVYAY